MVLKTPVAHYCCSYFRQCITNDFALQLEFCFSLSVEFRKMFNKLSQEVFVYSLVLIREMTAALRYCPIVIIATFSPASQIFVK